MEKYLIGYRKTDKTIIVEAYRREGDDDVKNVKEALLTKYNTVIEIENGEEELIKAYNYYSEIIEYDAIYTLITTQEGSKIEVAATSIKYPLKAVFLNILANTHVIIFYGEGVTISSSSFDYYYGEEAITTSLEVTSM